MDEPKDQKSRPLVVVVYLVLCFIVALGLIGLTSRRGKLSLRNGDVVRVRLAPFLTSLVSETSTQVIVEPREGSAGKVVFLQDSDSELAMIIPASDGRSFFCLYYADVVYRLVKVNPNEKSMPFPANSYLNYIVIASSYAVESAALEDWRTVLAYINALPDDVFKQETFGFRKLVLTSGITEHIWNMEHGFID